MAPDTDNSAGRNGESETLEFKQSMGTRRDPTTTLTSPGRYYRPAVFLCQYQAFASVGMTGGDCGTAPVTVKAWEQ